MEITCKYTPIDMNLVFRGLCYHNALSDPLDNSNSLGQESRHAQTPVAMCM